MKLLDFIRNIVLSFFVGAAALFLVSALGQGLDKYVFNDRPLWQLWAIYLAAGAFLVYIYQAVSDNTEH